MAEFSRTAKPRSLLSLNGSLADADYLHTSDVGPATIDTDQSNDSAISISLGISWQLEEYLSKEMNNIKSINNILVIASKDDDFWCTTCQEYLMWRFSKIGIPFLNFINDLQDMKEEAIGQLETDDDTLIIQLRGKEPSRWSSSFYKLQITGRSSTTKDVLTALMWLASVLRPAPDRHLYYSSVALTGRSADYNIITEPLLPLTNEPSACWHALFPRKVISYGHPIPRRDGCMRGIEVTWSLMLYLAGVEFPVEENGEIVLAGYHTILRPIIQAANRNELQWHLQTSNSSEEGPPFEKGFSDEVVQPKIPKERCLSFEELKDHHRHFID